MNATDLSGLDVREGLKKDEEDAPPGRAGSFTTTVRLILAVAALYRQRWRIEDAFNLVKRLLGLAYFFAGTQNAIALQLWATWLLYSVLVDLTDAVAEALALRYQALSVEMVYRGLYHFTQAYHRGEATDPVGYLAAHAKELGIIKQKRRRKKDLTKSSPP